MPKHPTKDQEDIEKAFNLLRFFIADHPEVGSVTWASALWSVLVAGYKASGADYAEFSSECDKVKIHFKEWYKQ